MLTIYLKDSEPRQRLKSSMHEIHDMYSDISSTGYWLDNRGKDEFDERLSRALALFFKHKTVVDMGCGRGRYVKTFVDHGIQCRGYDGNPLTSELEFCEVLDLSNPVELGQFDWVLSLEVGEHIPREYESVFIDNLHKHNTKGIILSWAKPGQPGKGHFNCRPRKYIKNKFAGMGCENDLGLERLLRGFAYLGWFKRNIMVFTR